MIRQQVGDVLEIHYEGNWFYIVVLTKIVMFGGNIIFAFHNRGKKLSYDELLKSRKGFNVVADLILAKREGIVQRIGKVEAVDHYFTTKYMRGSWTDKEGKHRGDWSIYKISDPRKHIAEVKRLSGKYKNAMDRVTYPFSAVARMVLGNYKPNKDNYLYLEKFVDKAS